MCLSDSSPHRRLQRACRRRRVPTVEPCGAMRASPLPRRDPRANLPRPPKAVGENGCRFPTAPVNRCAMSCPGPASRRRADRRAARLVGGQAADQLPTFRALWDRWDVGLFTKVAQYGYLSPSYGDRTEVDFPALPLLLRVVHVAVPDWVLAGLVVSLLAGGAGAMGLWRLAADEVGPAHARDAVVFLVLFPYAVFLFAGYSEALFLGCTCWAWVAARQQRWAVAAVLAAGAAATRVLGIPFAVALAVEYGVSRWRAGHRTPGWRSLWLVLPAVPVSYTHLRAHETVLDLVCRLLLEKK